MTTTAGKYVKIFSRVDDFENSRFWHSSFRRLGNFHVKIICKLTLIHGMNSNISYIYFAACSCISLVDLVSGLIIVYVCTLLSPSSQ